MILDRKYILKELLDRVRDISDVSYQQRVWIKGIGPECDDFDEAVCKFCEICKPIIDEYKNYKLTEEQCSVLWQFYNQFYSFAMDHNHPEEFITTSEWIAITQEAKEVLKAFNYQQS